MVMVIVPKRFVRRFCNFPFGKVTFYKKMKRQTTDFSILLFTVLFFALNAGFFSLLPIDGIGFCFYMFLLLLVAYLISENYIKFQTFILPYFYGLLWLFVLLIWKNKGTFNCLYSWFLGGVIFFTIAYINFKSKVFLFSLYVVLFLSVLFLYMEMLCGFHLPISRFSKLGISLKVYGFFVPTFLFTNENDLSSFLVLLFCFLRTLDNRNKLILDLFMFPLVFFILLITQARLCIVAIIFYYLYCISLKLKKKERFALFFVIFVFSLYIFISYIFPYIMQLKNIKSQSSLTIRLNLLIAGLKNIFMENNFLGLGPGAFPSIITKNSNTGTIIDPHCFFIELGVEVGLVFLILYIYFIISFFLNEKEKKMRAFFVVFLICNFCSSRFTGILWNWFFLAFFIRRYFEIKEM